MADLNWDDLAPESGISWDELSTEPVAERSWGEAAEDTGRQLAAGAAATGKALGAIAGLSEFAPVRAAGEWVEEKGKFAEDYWRGENNSKLSQQRQQELSDADKRAEAAREKYGFAGGMGQAFWDAIKDPENLVEQIPNFLAMAGVGGLTRSVATSVIAGGLLQGGDIASGYSEAMSKVPLDEYRKDPDFQRLVSNGISEQDAARQLADLYKPLVLGAATTLSAGVNAAVPGGTAIEKVLSGQFQKTGVKGAVKAFAGEATSEALEEGPFGQMVSNLAEQQVNSQRGLLDNVDVAMGKGAALGGVMGGGINVAGQLVAKRQVDALNAQQAMQDLAAAQNADQAADAAMRAAEVDLDGTVAEASSAVVDYHNLDQILQEENRQQAVADAAETGETVEAKQWGGEDPIERFDGWSTDRLIDLAQQRPELAVEINNLLVEREQRDTKRRQSAELSRQLQGNKREEVDTTLDPVRGFVTEMRNTNTPAAQAFVRDYESGRITDTDIQRMIMLERQRASTNEADARIASSAEGAQPDMTAPPSREDRTQAMIRDYMGKQANQAQRTQAQQLADNEAGQFSNARAQLADEIPAEQPINRALDRTELQALRRAAAGLERPQDGVFLRVTDDGAAVATGPKGARIPDSFRKFANDNGLTFRAERRLPRYDRGDMTSGGNRVVGAKSEPMPIAYRGDGALYFGEIGGEALDRTGNTRFSQVRVEPNVNGHQVVTAPASMGDKMRDAFRAAGIAAVRVVNNAKEVAFRIGKTVTPDAVQGVVARFSNARQDIPSGEDVRALEAAAQPLPIDDNADISPRRKVNVEPAKPSAQPVAAADQADYEAIVAATSKEFGDTRGVRIVSREELDQSGKSVPGRVSREEASVIDSIARLFKKRVVYFRSDKIKADGFIGGKDNNTLYLNATGQSNISHLVVFGHELLHALRRDHPEAYAALEKVVMANMNDEQKAKFKDYYGKGATAEEVVADLFGNRFAEASFWQEVFSEIAATHEQSAAKRIITRLASALYGMVDKAISALKVNRTFATDEYVSNLRDIRAAVKEAVKTYAEFQRTNSEAAEQGGEVLYSKRTSDNGHKRTKKGDYVGAPAGMTPAKLGALRLRLHKLTKEGAPGRFWYEESSEAILAAAEGDKALAEKIAGLLAIYSPQMTVSGNTTVGLKALYQWMNGQPIKAKTGSQDRKAQAWMDGTMGEEDALQIKTGNFFINLMRKIDEDRYGFEKQGATIDMWMARVFGYGSKAIGSSARYYFAEREVKKIAEELGWEPQQVQAALWVSIKSRVEEIADEAREIGKKNGWLKRKVTKSGGKENISWVPVDGEAREKYELLQLKMALGLDDAIAAEGIGKSKYNFGTALKERVGQISWEAMPGKTSGVLPGIFDAPLEQQAEYLAAIDAALRDENGNDLIAKELGLPVLRTVFGPSAWQMIVGAGAQTVVAVATDRDQGNKKVSVSAPAHELLNLYAAIRGYVLAQEAVVWHYPVFDAAKKNANGVQLDFGRDPSHDEVVELYNAIHDVSGREDWAPAYVPGVGVRVLNFAEPQYDKEKQDWSYWDAAGNEHRAATKEALLPLAQADGVDNSTFQKVVREAAKRIEAKVYFDTFQSDGDYVGNDWTKAPKGEQYKEIINGDNRGAARRSGRSDLQGWVESELRPRTQRVNEEFAEKYGWGRTSFSTARSDATGSGRDRSVSEAGRDALAEYGQGTEGSVSVVGQHWSKAQRNNLNGAYYGTGLGGAERPRVMAAKDRRLRSRIYFYVHKNGDQTDVTPEAGVGSVRHDVRLNNLYDATQRFDIQQQINATEVDGWPVQRGSAEWSNLFESAVIDAGYDGYLSPFGDQRAAVLIGDHVVHLSRSRQTDTPEFKKWFGDSKVVDAEGNPLVVYHGTRMDFSEFGTPDDDFQSYSALQSMGFWFTGSHAAAEKFAKAKRGILGEGGPRIVPVYLAISNPVVINGGWNALMMEVFGKPDYWGDAGFREWVSNKKKQGHDGIVWVGANTDRAGVRTDYVAFSPTQIKSAIGNNGQFDGSNPDIRMSTQRWYYSQLSRQIESAPEKVFGPAKQVKAWLQSNKAKLGIKDDEIQWTGINDWLDLQQRVTKADVLNYLQQNGVQVQEVMKGVSKTNLTAKKASDFSQIELEKFPGYEGIEPTDWLIFNDKKDWVGTYQNGAESAAEAAEAYRKEAQDEGYDGVLTGGETKYAQYVLPGGENYRELLLTLPKKKATIKPDGEKFAVMLPDGRRFGLYSSLADAESALNRTDGQIGPNFQSQHWSDTKNILAHIRFNTRTDADGNKVLFIEEIQSDAGQMKRDGKSDWNAPFINDTKSWVALALKRMMRYAADNGFEKIAFIDGQQSTDRYWKHELIAPAVERWNAISKPESVRELGEDVLGRKMYPLVPLDHVDTGMLPMLKHDQVVDAVVSRIPVDVVNMLSKHDLTAEQLVRDGDMVFDNLPASDRGRAASALGAAIGETGASVRAKLEGLDSAGADVQLLPALRASDLNAREVLGVVSPGTIFNGLGSGLPEKSASTSPVTKPASSQDGRGFEQKLGATELAKLLNAHAEIKYGHEGLLQHSVEPPPGQGMKTFYDRIVPQVVNDVLKKVGGGRVESIRFNDFESKNGASDDKLLSDLGVEVNGTRPAGQPGFTITPEMREKVAGGQPLFSRQRFQPTGNETYLRDLRSALTQLTSGDKETRSRGSAFYFKVMDVPPVLRNLIAKDGSKPFKKSDQGLWGSGSSIASKATNTHAVSEHGAAVDPQVVMRLPQLVADPVAVFSGESGTNAASYRIVVDGGIVAVEPKGLRSFIMTIFPQSASQINGWAKAGLLHYINEKAASRAALLEALPVDQSHKFPQVDWSMAQEKAKVNGRTVVTSDDIEQLPDLALSTPRFNPSVQPVWNNSEPTWWENMRRKYQDRFIDAREILKEIKAQVGSFADKWDGYLQEQLYHSRVASQVKDFNDLHMRPLMQLLVAAKADVRNFENFLWARHAPERNAQIAKVNPAMPDGGSGLTDAQAADVMAGRDVTLPDGTVVQGVDQGKLNLYRQLAGRIDQMVKDTGDILVAGGQEKASTVAAWRNAYQFYVPLQRDDEDGGMQGSGQGYSARGGVKRAMGSFKNVEEIIGNIAAARERAIKRVEKSKPIMAFFGMAIQAPNPKFWAPIKPGIDATKLQQELIAMGINPANAQQMADKPVVRYIDPRTGLVTERPNQLFMDSENVVALRIDGEDRYLVFNADSKRALELARSLKNISVDHIEGVAKMIAPATRWMASVNTQYNPLFGITNIIRDTQGLLLNLSTTPLAGKQGAVLKEIPAMLAGIYADLRSRRAGNGPTNSAASRIFEEMRHEGGTTGYMDLFSDAGSRTKALLRDAGVASNKLDQVWQTAGGKKVVEDIIGGWLSDYNETLENATRAAAYKVALDNGMSKARAAELAKNLTVNFNRKGQSGSAIGAMYAFFNASVQGTQRLAETLKGPKGKQIIAGGIALGALQAIALAAAGFDGDEPPEFVRERNLIIPTGGGKYLTIPMPLGFHVLHNIGRATVEAALFPRLAKEKLTGLISTFVNSFNPVGSGTLAQTLAPTVADPIVALSENKNWQGQPIYREGFDKTKPGHMLAKDTAMPISKWLAEKINALTGGTDYQRGLFSPSPDQIDYLAAQAGGGVWRETSKISQAVKSAATGEELPPHKIPLVGKFYGNTNAQSSQANRYYRALEEMRSHEAEIKGRRKDGKPIEDYMRDNPDARLWQQADKSEKRVQFLKRMKRKATEAGDKARVKEMERQITEEMVRFNERVESTRGR